MIIIHSLAHHVIITPKFTFPTKESIGGGVGGGWWICPVSSMGWNSCIWSLLTILIWAPLFITTWRATQVPSESRRILTFISQEMDQACLYGRKATAYYSTTINSVPIQCKKTIIRKAEQFSGLLSWCFVYFLIRKKQKQHFIHTQTDFCIVLGTILLHRAELCGSSSNQFSERLTTINSECTFLHMLFGYFLLRFYRSLKHKIYGCR